MPPSFIEPSSKAFLSPVLLQEEGIITCMRIIMVLYTRLMFVRAYQSLKLQRRYVAPNQHVASIGGHTFDKLNNFTGI